MYCRLSNKALVAHAMVDGRWLFHWPCAPALMQMRPYDCRCHVPRSVAVPAALSASSDANETMWLQMPCSKVGGCSSGLVRQL